jgi:hypothetical protein
MITREDMRFATCFQLATMIADDWDGWPSAIKDTFERLSHIDEPDGTFVGGGVTGMQLPMLKAWECEPESITNIKRLLSLSAVTKELRTILHHSDGWKTELSDKFKKELNLRIFEYEKQIKQLTDSEPAVCEIKL